MSQQWKELAVLIDLAKSRKPDISEISTDGYIETEVILSPTAQFAQFLLPKVRVVVETLNRQVLTEAGEDIKDLTSVSEDRLPVKFAHASNTLDRQIQFNVTTPRVNNREFVLRVGTVVIDHLDYLVTKKCPNGPGKITFRFQ